MIPLNFERSVAARRRAAAIANGTTPGSGSSPASASVREDESTDAASTIDSNGSATKRSTKHRNGLPCLQGFLIRPTSYHHGDARSLYNRPVRVDEYDDADGVGLSAAIAASASSGSGGGDNGGDAVVESGQQPSGAEGRRTSNTRETSEPRLEEGATLGAASAGEVGTAGPDWDSRRRVRSLRLGATDNMYHYRTRPSPGGSGQSSERNATAASEAEGEPVRNGSQHRTRTSTGGNGTLAPPETPTELVRVPSSHRDAARAPAPVPILQNRSSIPTGQASPAPSTRSDGTSGRAGAEPGDEGRSSTRQRPPPPSMQPIRTDTAYLHDPRRDQLPAQNARSDIDMTSGSGMTTAGPSTPIAPPSFTPTAQPQPAPQSRTPLPHTSQQQQQPSTPTVSQPTHQIGHWQTYGPGMAPPPYTEQPVFHYPFGRHRQTDANGPGPSTAGVSGSGAGGSSASRGLTWAREPIGRARNRAGGRSGRNSRASSADRDSGREGEGEEGEEGMTRSASAEGSSTGIDNNVQVATGAEAPETRQQREQSIERKRKKGALEPLGLPSPFAKASKDRVPDFKSGLREGTIGAWAEVREGLKGPVGLPWYWAKEGGVLGLIGGLSYGITVLALCPISASIVFVNHSSRGAIRSTRTAHQNRQLRKSSSSSATSRARAASTSKLPRTGSIDDSRSLRRRTSILSRTTSRASISPTNERVSMSGDELRRAVSIHGTGVDSDDPETGSGTARGDATDRDETGAGAGSSTLTRATSRGSRWRRSRRAAKAKAKRADPDVPPGPAAAAGAGAGVGDGEVEEGTPTNSTLQSSSGRSAAGASSVGHVAGSTRVGDSPADRRLTELEREAKWGNFDGTNVGPGIGGSASGAHLGPALGERYLSTLERETKLNLFPETHISGPSGRTGSLLDRPTGQGHGVGGEKTVSGSPKRGTHQTSPSISVSMHGDHPGGAANGTGSADGEGTSRLELDTKWPISDSPLGLSPDVQTGTQVSRSRDAPDRYGPVAGSRRPGSGHEGRDGHDGERVTGLEMDTKWQLPSETDTALEQSLSHVRSNSTSDDRALREKMALEGRRAGTEPDRAAVAAYRVAHPRSNGAMEVRRGLPAPPILGLALGSHSEEQQVQDVAREVGGGEEDLPVVQAVDAGVSFQNGAAYTHTPIQSQARPGEQVAGPRSPRTPIPEPAPVQTQTVPQSYTSSARTAPGVTPPPPLMTPTAYEMDIKWPIPDTDLSAPVQSRPLPASRATEHGDVMVARTPEPSPPEPILQTPPAAGRHLPSMPQQQRTQVRTANPPAIPATYGLEGPPERRIGYPPMTKTDTVPSSSTRSRDSDLEAETGTFADTDPEASLDSSLTPSQAKAFSLHMSDNDHAHGHPSPLSVSTSSRAPSTTLSKGIPTSGSGESPLSSSSPMTRLSLSPITPFDMERHYRQGFKREGYGFCSGVEMGGEGGRRLSL